MEVQWPMADCASDCASDMPTIRRGCRNPSAPPAPPPVAACDDHADAALLVRRAERQPVWVGLGCPRGGIKQVALRVLPNCNEPAAASRVIRSGCGCRGTAGLAHVRCQLRVLAAASESPHQPHRHRRVHDVQAPVHRPDDDRDGVCRARTNLHAPAGRPWGRDVRTSDV